MLTVLGTCGAFAGVASEGADRRKACRHTCSDRGYGAGKVQGSVERVPGSSKHAFLACVCSEGPEPDPLELSADDLVPADRRR